MEVNETYMRAKTGDVGLAEEIYDRATPERQEFFEQRIVGKVARKRLTDALKQHGVEGMGYGQCTNAIYQPILGGKTADVKRAKGLPAKANLRDNLNAEELIKLNFAELLAKSRIESARSKGNRACAIECSMAGRAVVAALVGGA
jgi:hypothetical protein